MFPSNPSLHMQDPIVSSQFPWFEHKPSSGQSNSVNGRYYVYKVTISIKRNIISLEQSRPCLPDSHVHCPMPVSQTPAPLQSPGHFNSRNKKL